MLKLPKRSVVVVARTTAALASALAERTMPPKYKFTVVLAGKPPPVKLTFVPTGPRPGTASTYAFSGPGVRVGVEVGVGVGVRVGVGVGVGGLSIRSHHTFTRAPPVRS